MKTILVTGGAGFIGSHTCLMLLEKGYKVYVLDSYIQGNSQPPKWDPRSWLGIYVGHSPCHAGSVTLVLNSSTLHVSPQFYVVFDDTFSTVPYMQNSEVPQIGKT